MPRSLRILHRTEYKYDRKITLNPHKLMLRPRDGHDLWVDDAVLTIRPRAELRWYFDTFGNSIAEATFSEPTDSLFIESELLLRRYGSDVHARMEGDHVCPYPFVYSDEDARDLSPYVDLHNPQDAGVLDQWLAQHFTDRPGSAVPFLRSLSHTIHRVTGYSRREEMGTQTAGETIAKGLGTCRDFAFLFMEATRRFGFAARFVTGYLDSGAGPDAPVGGGATHAWADVFVPGEGWIEFDPTNRLTAGSALIRVATTRTPTQASPISGSYSGNGAVFLGLTVSVTVTNMD
ncbi:transglutaminase family protein [Puniceibacterium sediminis]|uniref:Transglutaminase-like enzyme, putative cysteine protease n=1 Tax=Puniceibacterium sediminis TaxID=1608407 RepID=A0A238UU37_9RHOB|nr:transglutaminase family protein [Puniceibacterium sediminis]SNR24769.1 Transglutaminase-like enzyme, putative cysteine protease [Puniceibacterium sediminis]